MRHVRPRPVSLQRSHGLMSCGPELSLHWVGGYRLACILTYPPCCCHLPACCRCISETQYCQGSTVHTCGTGLRCNFNEQAIGCEPVQSDPQPTNPCEDSAHDQCLSEVGEGEAVAGGWLSGHAELCMQGACQESMRCALHCSCSIPAAGIAANGIITARPFCCPLLQTSYCQGKTLHTCGAGLRCNFNEQAIGCEPVDSDPEPTNPCEDSAHDQCITEVGAGEAVAGG